ncbi:ATP-binding protein [Pontiella desulfatans]|nr:ATP-binding protein [Pontiella desulfatans]
MIKRLIWMERIEEAWRERSIIWLSGVRRVGKTCLCKSLDSVEYFDCELPRIRRLLDDPEAFLEQFSKSRVVLDEIHRLPDPSELLKIAADHYPDIRIVATGSSTLGASAKFKDTLAGRKRDIWLSPIIQQELEEFSDKGMDHRFLRGGLPPFFLAGEYPERDYQEWLDAFWAKDIQELYRLERRDSFMKFFELLMQQSGSVFEASFMASPCGVSRTTLQNYLRVLEDTYAMTVIKPYFSNKTKEIVSAPKVYGFDTGFVAFNRGWLDIRPEDRGILWEHVVLNELLAFGFKQQIRYWRTKQGREIDFVIVRRGKPPVAIEVKWNSTGKGDHKHLVSFARSYPDAELFVVAGNIDRSFSRKHGEHTVYYMGLAQLVAELSTSS